jgi:hypothetical protein
VGAHQRHARYMSAIATWWAQRPHVGRPDKRTWLVLTVMTVALTVLTTALLRQPGGRVVLERPVSHAGGVAQPLPSEQSSPAESASTASSVPADPASSTVVPPQPPAPPPAQPTNAAESPKRNPPTATPPPFSALAGFRCPDTANSGFTTRHVPGTWYVVTGGGWTGDGCQGHLVAMPMSGDPNRDDLNNVMLWWFKMPPRPKCAVEVYVPRGPNIRDAAGAPATYFVYGTTDGSGSTIGRFNIDQVPNQGRWVAVGSFPATSGQLSVRLMNRGVSNADHSHLGGSAVRVNC